MSWKRLSAVATVAALVVGGMAAAPPAWAGPAEIDLLSSYVGSWSGAGEFRNEPNAPEPFRCRLSIAKGSASKINYQGRCALANMNLSVAGTILYNDAGRQYEAVMSSNAGFTGTAVGKKIGDQIVFDLREKQKDRGGNDVAIGARIKLIGGSITVDFQVEFNDSGQVATATVPFSR